MTMATTARRPKAAPRRRAAKDWRVDDNGARGWISYRRACSLKNDNHPLAYHADWAGPVKLVESPHGGELSLRYDFYLDQELGYEGDPTIDADMAGENERLEAAFARLAAAFDESSRVTGWSPPPLEAFARWLRQCGYEPSEDEDHNLRLSIRRRGATGQVKLIHEEGRLRLTMPLGRWSDLPAANRHAMQKLASLANARCRLARIVWESHEALDACAACVDLSGLPYTPHQSRRMESFWREMTRLSMTALDLAVSQLAQELSVLADDKEQELVKLIPC
jgi:hypothetical protein